jgi:hypothetical protein
MREIPFSIPVSGVVRIDGDSATIIVNKAETIISLEAGAQAGKRLSLGPGRSMFDVILESARELIERRGFNRFSAPELYSVALENFPALKRGSFMSRVIASTPNHPSYKHHTSQRDYLSRVGPGLFALNDEYRFNTASDGSSIYQNRLGNLKK